MNGELEGMWKETVLEYFGLLAYLSSVESEESHESGTVRVFGSVPLPVFEPSKARVFRRDSPPTRSRRSEGSGGESFSMLTSVEGNAVQGRMLL
jgi:hypothetical protein